MTRRWQGNSFQRLQDASGGSSKRQGLLYALLFMLEEDE